MSFLANGPILRAKVVCSILVFVNFDINQNLSDPIEMRLRSTRWKLRDLCRISSQLNPSPKIVAL